MMDTFDLAQQFLAADVALQHRAGGAGEVLAQELFGGQEMLLGAHIGAQHGAGAVLGVAEALE